MQTSLEYRKRIPHLGLISLLSGLAAMVFPLLAIGFLLAFNGGAGYLQSLILGAPLALISLLLGIASLASDQRQPGQPASKPGMAGIALGVLYFIIAAILVLILIGPYLAQQIM